MAEDQNEIRSMEGIAQQEEGGCEACFKAKQFSDELIGRLPVLNDQDEQTLKEAKQVAQQANELVAEYKQYLNAISLQDIQQVADENMYEEKNSLE